MTALSGGTGLAVLEPVAADAAGRALLLDVLADADASPEARAGACFVLSHYQRTKQPATAFARLLADRSQPAALRSAAAMAIGDLDARLGFAMLVEVLQAVDDNPTVRSAAAAALGWTGQAGALGPLADTLDDRADAPDVRAACAEALGYLGLGDGAVETLMASAAEHTLRVRFWSLFALGELARLDETYRKPVVELATAVAQSDLRVVRGWWSVRREAEGAIHKARSDGTRPPSLLAAVGPAAAEAAAGAFADQAVRAARLPPERVLEVSREVRFEPADGDLVAHFPWLGLTVTEPWDGTAEDVVGAAAVAGHRVGTKLTNRGILFLQPWRDPE